MDYNFRLTLSRPDKLATEENETSKEFNNFIVDMGDRISTIPAYQVHNPSKTSVVLHSVFSWVPDGSPCNKIHRC